MPTINQLAAVDTISSGDQVPIYSSTNGDARKMSIALLVAYLSGQITSIDDMLTQHAAPSATGFSVQVNNDSLNVWLVLTPLAGYAAGTIVLPSVANCVDKQEILVNCTQSVTTLTISNGGATVTGAPTTLAANAFFRLRYDATNTTWYRVG